MKDSRFTVAQSSTCHSLDKRVLRLEQAIGELRQNRQQHSSRRHLSFRPGNLLRHLEAIAEDAEEVQRKAQARDD